VLSSVTDVFNLRREIILRFKKKGSRQENISKIDSGVLDGSEECATLSASERV